MSAHNKPILNTQGQIAHLKSKGIQFHYMSEDAAYTYLEQNNNYFKLRAYRKNFQKHPDGASAGQYIDLDFAMLKDLAIIDMRLRYVLIHLALDVEHFAKVKLLKAIADSTEDGYQIVVDYMEQLAADDIANGTHRLDTLNNELRRNKNNPYCGGIIDNYDGDYPVWAFVEIIPLGSFVHFYGFCAERLQNKNMTDEFFLLSAIKKLRNAVAHNNCILHDMGAKDCVHKVNYKVTRALSSISKTTREKLKNERMQQIVTLLYTHSVIVSSAGVRASEKEALTRLIERMFKHPEYYAKNDMIRTNFAFFKKVVDIFFL